jgi:hypothetical protein
LLFLFLKGMTGALAPFSYLVNYIIIKLKEKMRTIPTKARNGTLELHSSTPYYLTFIT